MNLLLPGKRRTPETVDFPGFFGIDATRFELATSASRTQRSTKLSHASIQTYVCFPLTVSFYGAFSDALRNCQLDYDIIFVPTRQAPVQKLMYLHCIGVNDW